MTDQTTDLLGKELTDDEKEPGAEKQSTQRKK